ncbi:hypothetical protein UPYG_G00049530 [Umbra pygmaea]|uniref:B30.2/SPRY domain-containing protein n=1 Tax=Umbra pygmaea TaxID=75934 RepID=A0ABD0YDC1_UMBPY
MRSPLELDLSYNHPGDSGVKLFSAGLEDPTWRLHKLNLDHGGELRMKSGPRKYAVNLTLDPNTANSRLSLSEGNRKVTCKKKKQWYPDNPKRFEYGNQILCKEGLTRRCYWEVEWCGIEVSISVTYKGINRRGMGEDSQLGHNNKSWSLYCYENIYYASHNKEFTSITPTASWSNRVGVYLDWPSGILSFYSVFSDTLTHIHTFHSTFTEEIYPGFGIGSGSSVSLCKVE